MKKTYGFVLLSEQASRRKEDEAICEVVMGLCLGREFRSHDMTSIQNIREVYWKSVDRQ